MGWDSEGRWRATFNTPEAAETIYYLLTLARAPFETEDGRTLAGAAFAPLGGGREMGMKWDRTEIGKLHHRLETTMIYVTHDKVEAMTMGDRICVMKDGLIQQVHEPLTLYDRPANLFVDSFIGTPPMNLFRGRIERSGRSFLFTDDDVSILLPESWRDTAARCRPTRPIKGMLSTSTVAEAP